MPPSQLHIATSALQRLVKEEASYHKELESQKKRIAELEKQTDDQDENREFKLKQEVSRACIIKSWHQEAVRPHYPWLPVYDDDIYCDYWTCLRRGESSCYDTVLTHRRKKPLKKPKQSSRR